MSLDKSKITHLIWDWNGTLLDDTGLCVKVLNSLLVKYGRPAVSLKSYRANFCFPVRRYYEFLGIHASDEEFVRMGDVFIADYLTGLPECALHQGARELLQSLKVAGLRQAVLSAAEQQVLLKALKSFDIDDLFEKIVGIENYLAASKLHTGERLMREWANLPGETLLIGDSPHDFEVATHLGCHCVLVAAGHVDEERLRICGCPVFPDFSSLANFLGKKLV